MNRSTEDIRLELTNSRELDWKRWGPYLADRAWGTVREDYSEDGSAWSYFPFDHAHLRAFRWNEDGLGGICDRRQNLCFSVALWNGNDRILKERLFGLSGPEGNHGEDVKECYYYLDNTPTHSYMRFLYKYPHAEFPYAKLRAENRRRGKTDPEFELVDTGVFDEDRYFDVFIEYAKADCDDIVVRVTVINRSPDPAPITVLPTVWFRNQWSWFDHPPKPVLKRGGKSAVDIEHRDLGSFRLWCEGDPELLFTENESNYEALFRGENASPFVKDGIGRYVIDGDRSAVNPQEIGTKAAARYDFEVPGNGYETIWLRLTAAEIAPDDPASDCEAILEQRLAEADEFYDGVVPDQLSGDERLVMRQALAGLLWSKQYYHYVVRDWINGDPAFAPPPKGRRKGRNSAWKHLFNEDVVSMPDKWEYPWYAAWDLAFHAIPLALIDPEFAKRQLVLLLREWYMHPNGQIPAYEWAFGDVNPPVHAWAALRVYQIEARRKGQGDRAFLEKVFHKLLLNFTWWVNRKDAEGNNVFEGGFLGLDNIGVFDRSAPLPTGGNIEQSDGTSWMAMFCLNMLAIALELAREDRVYEDVATKFFEHFVYISDAMNNVGEDNTELWDERDGFYYDVLHLPNGENLPIRLRSMVGLIPIFAVETIDAELLDRLPNFRRRTDWFLKNRPDLTDRIACMQKPGQDGRFLLALIKPDRLRRVLRMMLSENEFLSDFGIRALSRVHRTNPYLLNIGGTEYKVEYEPAESRSGMFGGNSNWRGPIWMPVNYLLIESLQKFDHYFGDGFKVEFPTGSERKLSLWDISQELERRLARIFLRDEEDGSRPVFGNCDKFQTDPNFRDYPLFYEYFHGDHGSGLGASHQTGWTGLVAKVLQQIGEYGKNDEFETE